MLKISEENLGKRQFINALDAFSSKYKTYPNYRSQSDINTAISCTELLIQNSLDTNQDIPNWFLSIYTQLYRNMNVYRTRNTGFECKFNFPCDSRFRNSKIKEIKYTVGYKYKYQNYNSHYLNKDGFCISLEIAYFTKKFKEKQINLYYHSTGTVTLCTPFNSKFDKKIGKIQFQNENLAYGIMTRKFSSNQKRYFTLITGEFLNFINQKTNNDVLS